MKPQIAQITPISRIDLWELKEDGTRLRAVRAWEGGSEERGDAEEKRMRTAIGVVTAVAALLVMAGCGESGGAAPAVPVTARTGANDATYVAEIKKLESADVTAEIEKATAAGDWRFVGVMGIGLSVPGVSDYHEKFASKFGCRAMPDTSDAIESDEHMKLQLVAREYAEKYNRALLAKIAARAER